MALERRFFPNHMNLKWATSLLLGIILSVGGLYLAFRNVPFSTLWDYLGTIDYIWVLPAVLLAILSFVCRVLRWQVILGSIQRVSFWTAFHPLMIAFMINSVLPGRVGELARPAILKKNANVHYGSGLATVAAERAFDLIVILVLFFSVMSGTTIDPEFSISFSDHQINKETLERIIAGFAKLSLVLIAGMVVVSIDTSRRWIARLIMGIPAYGLFFLGKDKQTIIAHKVCRRLVAVMESIASGFAMVKSPRKLALCLLLSFIVWVLAVLSYAVFALGCPGIEIDLIEMTAVVVIVCIFIALPSVPGYWGLWEAGGIFALTLFGVAHKEAAGFTLANHALQMIPVVIIGAFSAWIIGINIWQASTARDESDRSA